MQLRIASRQATYWLDDNFRECPQCLDLGCQVVVSKVGELSGMTPVCSVAGRYAGSNVLLHTVAGVDTTASGQEANPHASVSVKNLESRFMDSKNPAQPSLKQKAMHEVQDFVVISLYLALFFCALAAYTILLLKDYNTSSSMSYGFAIINALVIGKVILMGEMVHFGSELDNRPLYQTALYKAFMFTLLALAFHFVEEFVKRLIHGGGPGGVLREIRINDLIARSIVVFCTFIPLFAFMDLRRMLGEDEFYGLFFRSRVSDQDPSAGSLALRE